MNTTHTTDHDLLTNLRTAVDRAYENVLATRTEDATFSGFQAKRLVDEFRAYWNQIERHLACDCNLHDLDADAMRLVLFTFLGEVTDDPHTDEAAVANLACATASFFDRSGL